MIADDAFDADNVIRFWKERAEKAETDAANWSATAASYKLAYETARDKLVEQRDSLLKDVNDMMTRYAEMREALEEIDAYAITHNGWSVHTDYCWLKKIARNALAGVRGERETPCILNDGEEARLYLETRPKVGTRVLYYNVLHEVVDAGPWLGRKLAAVRSDRETYCEKEGEA